MTTIIVKDSTAASTSVDGTGEFRATLARITDASGQHVIDRQGDAYLGPQTFPRGKAVVISAYNHKSWEGVLPVGYGVIGANQYSAWVSGQFFMNTTGGKDTYNVVKALAAKGLGEWSYGFDVLDGTTDYNEIQALAPGAKRLLKELDVFEASPVLVGAGVGTATDSIKLRELDEQVAAMRSYNQFLRTLMNMRGSGLLAPKSADDVARSALSAMRRAELTLRGAA